MQLNAETIEGEGQSVSDVSTVRRLLFVLQSFYANLTGFFLPSPNARDVLRDCGLTSCAS
jgi:hypothetical protein